MIDVEVANATAAPAVEAAESAETNGFTECTGPQGSRKKLVDRIPLEGNEKPSVSPAGARGRRTCNVTQGVQGSSGGERAEPWGAWQ